MADAYDPTKETLSEWQQRQAMNAVAASQNQPNAIPNEPVRAADRTIGQTFTARGLTTPTTVNAPNANVGVIPTDAQAQQAGIGYYHNQFGDNLGPTQDLAGYHQSKPEGAVGSTGRVNPQEQDFWTANPNGAVVHPRTGELIGLGNTPMERFQKISEYGDNGMRQSARNEILLKYGQGSSDQGKAFDEMDKYGLVEPGSVRPGRQPPPNFIHIPEVNPALIAQRQQVQNEIATTRNQLRTASTIGSKKQPSQYQILNQKLNTLTQANNGLGLEHYRQSEEQRKATDQNSELQNKYMNDQASMAITNGLNQIKSPAGSDQYHADVIALRQQIGQQFPGATLDNRNRALFEKAATAHNAEAEFLARSQAEGKTPQLAGFHEGKATYKIPSTVGEQLSDEIQKRNTKALADLGLNAQQFAQIDKVEAGNLPKDAKGNVTDKNKFTGATGGEFTRVTTGGQQHIMRTDTYNRLATVIPPTAPQQEVKTDTSAPTAANQRAAKPPQVRQNGVIYNLQPDGSYK